MGFQMQDLDLILVPPGLFIMFTYHIYLLYRVLKYPSTTAIGYDNRNWMTWVERMMQGNANNASIAVSVISNNTVSSIYLATMCLSLCAFIGVWVGSPSSSSSGKVAVDVTFILGNTSLATITIKDTSMIFAFLLAFGVFVQSLRHYVQANSLISMPNKDVPVKYVQRLVLRGNNFWHIGLRLLYLAMALLFWSFGPMPMFVSCVVMVLILNHLDTNKEPVHLYLRGPKFSVKKKVEEVVAVRA
ncbi:uncharacterized protein LOC122085809 [Macadamia integrifolia]|uniref:uncharacterized protein LOC122085809 n=1 Tax=Macadamia integrifolia TaxID=60698 RepID=UPI001C4E3AE5|nr:uncharacterized protein LOC122085809 [Macadamia integrifolia]